MRKLLFTLLVGIMSGSIAFAQYCTTGGPTSTIDSEISAVSLVGQTTSINYNVTCPGVVGLRDFTTTQIADLVQGQSYTLNVTLGSCGGSYSNMGTAYIDWNQNGIFEASEAVFTQTPQGTPFAGVYPFAVPAGATIGTTRMRVIQNETTTATLPLDPCASFSWGSMIDFGITIATATGCTSATADAAIAAPAMICSGSNSNLTATNVSFGTGTVYQWQSSTDNITYTNITGADATSYSATGLTTNTWFRLVVTCGAQSATSTPALVQVISTALAGGTYTIDQNAAASATNFTSFADFQLAVGCVGISGPITVNVAPNSGPYNERLVLTEITGMSGANNITLNGNGNILSFSTTTSERAVLLLNGTDHLTVNNMIFEATGTTFGIGAQLANSANNNTFNNCQFLVSTTGTGTGLSGIVLGNSLTSATTTGNAGENNVFNSAQVIGGYYGVVFNALSGTSRQVGNKLLNSTVRDFYLYGVYLRGQEDADISGNDISRITRTINSTFYGVYLVNDCPGTLISNNRIHDNATSGPTTGSAYAINSSTVSGTAAKPIRVVNNAIYNMNSTGIHYTIYNIGTTANWQLYNNTITTVNPSQTGTSSVSVVYCTGAATNYELRNNIFHLDNGANGTNKYVLWFSNATSSILSNNNAFFANGSNAVVRFGTTNHATLADWQTATQAQDANSVFANPIFANLSAGNITPLSGSIDNIGVAIPGLTTDLNGNPRSATTPDPGAVEFTSISSDLALANTALARGICLSNADTARFTIQNTLGGNLDLSTDPVSVVWNVTGPVNSNGTLVVNSGTIATGASLVVSTNAVNMSVAGNYTLNAYITGNTHNGFAGNDTLNGAQIMVTAPYFETTPDSVLITTTTDTATLTALSQFYSLGGLDAGITNDNGSGGNFFDMQVTNTIVLQGFSTVNTSALANYRVYYKTGTHVGFTSDSTTWTSLGQYNVAGQGLNALASIVLNNELTLTPGLYSFHIISTNGGHRYKNGVTVGLPWASNADVTIFEGLGTANAPFPASTFSPRNYVGTIDYRLPSSNIAGLDWSLNGVSLGVSTPVLNVGPFPFSGTFNYTATYNSPCGPLTDIVYVTVNNGVTPCLTGTYTINSAQPTAGNNFQSFNDFVAKAVLEGVCGPVTVNVAPNSGPYNERVVIPAITGMSSTNTITINGNGNTLANAATVSAERATLLLDGADHFVFDSLNVDASAGTFGYAIQLTNSADSNVFKNGVYSTQANVTSINYSAVVMSGSLTSATSTGQSGNYNTFENNEIVGGYYGLTMNATSNTVRESGNKAINNTIRDFYLYGVYLRAQEDAVIEGNDIHRMNRTVNSTFYGIYLINDCPGTLISKNRIHDNATNGPTTGSAYAINSSTVSGTTAKPIRVVNNAIYNMNSTGIHYTIYNLGTTSNWQLYNNTITTVNPSQTTTSSVAVVYGTGLTTNYELRNNIFYLDNGVTGTNKYILWFSNASSILTSDNNVFYDNGSNAVVRLGTTNHTSLAAWQGTTGNPDANSFFADPVFANLGAGVFTPLAGAIDGIGASLPGVTDDIFGTPRPTSNPDPGAVEFMPVFSDVSLVSGSLSKAGVCLSATDTATFVIENVIGSILSLPSDSQTVVWNVTGPVNSNGTFVFNTGSLSLNDQAIGKVVVNMSVAGTYTLNAYITPNAYNSVAINDTLISTSLTVSNPTFEALPPVTTILDPTSTTNLRVNSPYLTGLTQPIITEICHFKTGNGAPAGGWPAYLIADDYIEIMGPPGFDLGGYTIEMYSASALTFSGVMPTGTVLSPNGTAIIATGQLGSSVPSPADYYYHLGATGSQGSTVVQGYVIKQGTTVIDAVVYGNMTFPAIAGVSTADWSGTTPGLSSSGNRLEGPYTKDATNWVNSGTAGSNNGQDPNVPNNGVQNPAGTDPNFSWTLNGASAGTTFGINVGPFTTSGTYNYIASFNGPCGVQTDTAVVIVDIPNCPAPSGLASNNVTASTADISWAGPANAEGYVISYGPVGFNPNTVAPVTELDFNNDSRFPRKGSGLLSTVGGATSTFASGFGSSDPTSGTNRAINTAAYPAQGTNPKTAGIEVAVSTEGMTNIFFNFDQRLSATASANWVVQYTTDITAATPVWVDAATFNYTTANVFESKSVDLSTVTALNNNPNAGFRVVSDFAPSATTYAPVGATSTYGTAGTSRFDMVQVLGTPTGLVGNTQNVTTNQGTINGLVYSTSYDVYVRGYCGTEYSTWTGPITINTVFGCPPGAICVTNTSPISSDGPYTPHQDTSACPGTVTANIPLGQIISKVDVVYSVTAQGGAWMNEQRSFVMSPTAGAGETPGIQGVGGTAGTMNYLRRDLTFANGLSGNVDFQLHLTRTWGSSPVGCNTIYQEVPDSAFTVIIYTEPGFVCPANAICANNVGKVSAPLFDAANPNWLSACPSNFQVTVPAGNEITGIDLFYDVVAANGAWMNEQRSFLYAPGNLGREVTASGVGGTAGTMSYARTGINIANGLTGTVDLQLHLGRTWPSSPATCDSTYQFINDSSVQLIVYYGPAATCPAPTAFVLDSVVGTSATVSWTSAATNFQIEYGTTGFTLGNGTIINGISATNATITGLATNTGYDVYVRAICGPGDTSAAVGPVNFTTPCGSFTAPFFEDFESTSASVNCWSTATLTATPRPWSIGTGSTGGAVTTAFSGTQNARHTSTSGGPHTSVLISPTIDLSGSTTNEIRFQYAQEQWFGDQNVLRVFYLASPTATPQLIFTDSTSRAAWTSATVALPGNSATSVIYFEGTDNWGHAIVVDDVYIGPPASGLNPFVLVTPPNNALVLVAGPANNPINVNWTSAGAGANYTWQAILPGGNFNAPLVQLPSNNSGADTNLTLTVGAVDALLAGLGVNIGDTATIVWNVRAIGGTDTLYGTTPHTLQLVRLGIATPLVVAAPANTNATSGLRMFNGSATHTFFRNAYMVFQSEYATAGITSGDNLSTIGFTLSTPSTGSVTAFVRVYVQNTTDANYLKGNVWTGITPGMSLVLEDTVTIPQGVTTFDFPLDSTFGYTGNNVYFASDWQLISGPITSLVYLCNNTVAGNLFNGQSTTAPPPTLTASSAFRPEIRWGVDRKADDLEVQALFAKGSNAIGAGYPETVQVLVRNNGYLPANKAVTLNATGANAFTGSQTVNLLSGQSTTLDFTGFNAGNVGFNTFTAAVPADMVGTNDTKTWVQETTTNRVGYADTTVTGNGGVGFNTGSGLLLTRHFMNGSRTITDVRIRISDNVASVGNAVYAVVLDSTGTIVGQSAPVTLATTDLSTYVTFPIPTPVAVTNEVFYVGLAQPANATGYFPCAFQAETPTRADAYFTAVLAGGTVSPVGGFRLMVDAILGMPDTLTPFALATPPNNSSYTATGTGSVSITWDRTTRSAGGTTPITYEWMVDLPTGSFNPPLATIPSANSGLDSVLVLSDAQINALLAANAVPPGVPTTVKWTVRATSGTLQRFADQPFNITLTGTAPCTDPTNVSTANATCDGTTVTWTSGAARIGSAIQYGPVGFTLGNGTVAAATSPANITGLMAGTSYDVYVLDTCTGGSASLWVGPVTFSTSPLPVASFTATQVNATINDVEFAFDASASTNATSYSWDFGGLGTASGVTANFTFTANGTYTVTLVATNACGSDTTTTQVTVGGISAEAPEVNLVNLFPNPTTGLVSVTGLMHTSGKHYIDVVDANGKVAFSTSVESGVAQTTMDLSKLAAGTYQVRISNDNNMVTKPLVIRR